jgi:mono/diheme cytochrome c family protein
MGKPTYLILLAGVVVSGPAGAADARQGERLHQQHCVGCHVSLTGGDPNSLYTRDNRRVTSLNGLRRQVQRCELQLGLRWFDDDIDSVTAYLNETFYKLQP